MFATSFKRYALIIIVALSGSGLFYAINQLNDHTPHEAYTIKTEPKHWPASQLKDELIKLLSDASHNDQAPHNPQISLLIVPFALMANKEHAAARLLLNQLPTYKDALEKHSHLKQIPAINKLFNAVETYDLSTLINRFQTLCKELLAIVTKLDVTPHGKHSYRPEDYKTYYDAKGEWFPFNDQTNWKEKQKSIYKILSQKRSKTVLDLGGNIGWFSILAESLGSQVICTDIDEASVDQLYHVTQKNNLNIKPALSCFGQSKLQAETVLCLALIHHLVFVQGMQLDEIVKTLSQKTEKTLIVEFVDINDAKIQRGLKDGKNHFGAKVHNTILNNFHHYAEKNYNIENIKKIGLQYFSSVQILESSPSTRSLLVFSK